MSVLNRVWDTQAGPGFVSWKTAAPDTGGLQYPGPGTWVTHTSDYCVESVVENEQVVALPVSPTLTVPVGVVQGLWLFDGDLTDESANSIDLTLIGLSGRYGPSTTPGESAFVKASTGQLQAPVDAALIIHGAITCELMFKPKDIVGASYGFLCLPTAAGGATANIPWSFLVLGTTNEWVYYHEYDGGGASFHQVDSGHFLVPGQWHHLTITRDTAGTLIRLYVNGKLAKREVVANASAGGSVAPLKLGDDGGTVRIDGDFGWLRVTDEEFRPEDVLASARATLPPELRP